MANEQQYFKNYSNGNASADEAKKVHRWVLLLLDKYLAGQASPSEKNILDTCFYDSLENFSAPVASKEALADKQAMWVQLLSLISNKKPAFGAKFFLHGWYRVAAVVVGLLCVAFTTYFLWPRFSSIQTSDSAIVAQQAVTRTNKNIQSVALPDGSVITLNRHSEISFNQNKFNQKDRPINFVRGEAFFEVVKNKEKPFVVHMDGLDVMVVGTSFNIRLNQSAGNKTIAVKTGEVIVRSRDREIAALLPGDVLKYEPQTDAFDIFKDNRSIANSWINGNLVFINAGADEIGAQIESYYEIGVAITGNAIPPAAKFNSVFPKGTAVKEVAEAIASLYHSSYKITNGKLVFYKKQE